MTIDVLNIDLLLHGLDEEPREILELSIGFTMCAPLHRHLVLDALRYRAENALKGDIVECGVWRGGMMQIAARAALLYREQGTNLPGIWLYDSFQGMPPPSSELDRDMYQGVHASVHLDRNPRTGPNGEPTVWCVADLEDVKEGMRQTGYPLAKLHFIAGLVEDTIPSQAPEEIAFLRVDTDWYESTKHVLDHLYDRVVSGGVIALDDYESWKGARTAVDEFLAERKLAPMLIRLDKGRVFVKP